MTGQMMAMQDLIPPTPLSLCTFLGKPKRMSICQFRIYFAAISFLYFLPGNGDEDFFLLISSGKHVCGREAFHHNNVIWCLCPCVPRSICGRYDSFLPNHYARKNMLSFRCYLPWFCQLSLMVIWYFTVDNSRTRTKVFSAQHTYQSFIRAGSLWLIDVCGVFMGICATSAVLSYLVGQKHNCTCDKM